jgi:signal transduction histidine kinase
MKDDQHFGWPPVIPSEVDPEEALSRYVHEFKHPITSIKGYANLVLMGAMDGQEAAERIHNIATRMEIVQSAVFDYLRARGTLD